MPKSSFSKCNIPWCKHRVYQTNEEGLCDKHWDMWKFTLLQMTILQTRLKDAYEKQQSLWTPQK